MARSDRGNGLSIPVLSVLSILSFVGWIALH